MDKNLNLTYRGHYFIMKIIITLLFAMMFIVLTACSGDIMNNANYNISENHEKSLQTENDVNYVGNKIIDNVHCDILVSQEKYVQNGSLERNCSTDFNTFKQDFISTDKQITFVTTKKIHEDIPEFTFTRIVGNYLDNHLIYDIPSAVEVTIIIEDDEGNITQIISGLSQSYSFINSDITFDDFNFDGYLDMRLKRWQDSIGGLVAREYFWLWDNEIAQFILNEQLMEIDQAGLNANSEDQRIVARQRVGASSRLLFYEYHNGTFTLEGVYYLGVPDVN